MVAALDRKLLRDLLRLWAQVLAIAMVLACGVMVLVLANGTRASLDLSRQSYYEDQRFADVFATLTRAPETLLPEIAAIPGVARIAPRIESAAIVDLPKMAEPVSAQVISLPASGAPVLNAPLLRAGRLPSPLKAGEVALYALRRDPWPDARRPVRRGDRGPAPDPHGDRTPALARAYLHDRPRRDDAGRQPFRRDLDGARGAGGGGRYGRGLQRDIAVAHAGGARRGGDRRARPPARPFMAARGHRGATGRSATPSCNPSWNSWVQWRWSFRRSSSRSRPFW